ncbi:MAG: hypothetical protein ACE37J_11940 [Pikeienuella sp.]|uniref:hypothetical protein n=1 Tax=Pikeienuella sp. TaxID=2831957 RepID=UPI00391951A9
MPYASDHGYSIEGQLPGTPDIGPRTRSLALALAFAAELRKEITDESVAEVVRRNTLPTYAAACASHDFCDANMVMASAFERVMERPFDFGSETDMDIWNRAWDAARLSGFATTAIACTGEA